MHSLQPIGLTRRILVAAADNTKSVSCKTISKMQVDHRIVIKRINYYIKSRANTFTLASSMMQ